MAPPLLIPPVYGRGQGLPVCVLPPYFFWLQGVGLPQHEFGCRRCRGEGARAPRVRASLLFLLVAGVALPQHEFGCRRYRGEGARKNLPPVPDDLHSHTCYGKKMRFLLKFPNRTATLEQLFAESHAPNSNITFVMEYWE